MTQKDIYIVSLLYKVFEQIPISKEEIKIELENTFSSLLGKDAMKFLFDELNDSVFDKIIYQASELAYVKVSEKRNKNILKYSVFQNIFENRDVDYSYSYSLKKLDLLSVFPEKITENKLESDKVQKYFKEMLKELGKINDSKQILYILEKYLWNISCENERISNDVSLFDYVKTLSAIAVALFKLIDNNIINETELGDLNIQDNMFLLVGFDFTGIQNFIFNIKSKKASKTLKGRSIYLGLLSRIISKYVIRELNLCDTNILLNGGGAFYILAPINYEEKIEEIRENIIRQILQFHGIEIYLSIDMVKLSRKDFQSISEKWSELREKLNAIKFQKYSFLEENEFYTYFFEKKQNKNKECSNCSNTDNELVINENNTQVCKLCDSFSKLTEDMKNTKFLSLSEIEKKEIIKENFDLYSVFKAFGYDLKFNKKGRENYLVNSTEFMEEKYTGFIFGSYQLPLNNNRIITFEELAELSEGDHKLALLKLDVDNLGYIFSQGINKDNSLTKVSMLSRMMNTFFEGYINELAAGQTFRNSIYIIYSGGDDSFLIGPWNKVIEFAIKLRQDFNRYVCNNKYISFTASIGVFNPKYPIVRSAEITEKYLQKAKNANISYMGKENIPIKNKISIMGYIFNWEELNKINEIKDFIVNLIEEKKESRSILEKIMKSTIGFERILKESVDGKLHRLRFHRLAYYLRDLETEDSKMIIDYYKTIVIDNILKKNKEEKIKNIMIIPVSVRLAEMEIREREN